MYNKKNNSFLQDLDGCFNLEDRPDGLYLAVYEPAGKGKKVSTDAVIEEIELQEIMDVDMGIVKKVVLESKGDFFKIAPPQKLLKKNKGICILISKDKMKVSLVLSPPQNTEEKIELQDVLEELSKRKITFGMDEEKIKNLIGEKIFNVETVIAEGKEVIDGKDGYIQYHFKNSKDISFPKELEDGKVDYKELGLIQNVKAGDILATIFHPVMGIDGVNVYGEVIPAYNGKKNIIQKGKNTSLNSEQTELISEINGQVSIVNDKIEVHECHQVPESVDHSTGNIDFLGSVIVKGNVMTGFTIKAEGNVEVFGVVEGASIEAGGDIILHRGIQGVEKGYLKAKGNIVAKYIGNCTIEASGNINSETIMHSTVLCGNILELTGRKGLLVGGVVKVGKLLKAKAIGSHMATVTEIEIGVDPTIISRYKQCKEEIILVQQELIKTEQIIDLLNKLKAKQAISPEKNELLLKSIRTKFLLSNKLKKMAEEYEELDKKVEEKNDGMLKVQDIIHPGVKINIGNSTMYVREDIKYCSIYKEGAEIKIGPL